MQNLVTTWKIMLVFSYIKKLLRLLVSMRKKTKSQKRFGCWCYLDRLAVRMVAPMGQLPSQPGNSPPLSSTPFWQILFGPAKILFTIQRNTCWSIWNYVSYCSGYDWDYWTLDTLFPKSLLSLLYSVMKYWIEINQTSPSVCQALLGTSSDPLHNQWEITANQVFEIKKRSLFSEAW